MLWHLSLHLVCSEWHCLEKHDRYHVRCKTRNEKSVSHDGLKFGKCGEEEFRKEERVGRDEVMVDVAWLVVNGGQRLSLISSSAVLLVLCDSRALLDML